MVCPFLFAQNPVYTLVYIRFWLFGRIIWYQKIRGFIKIPKKQKGTSKILYTPMYTEYFRGFMSKTRVVPLRVENEQADYIDLKTEEWGVSRGKAVETILDAYKEIEMICSWNGIDPKTCCEQIGDMFRTGEITFRDGRLSVR